MPSLITRPETCVGGILNVGESREQGNFLTTLGTTPEEDRAMFEEHGLNVARHDDDGANPRPDNRSQWLFTQLRFAHKASVPPRPDGAPNTAPV